MDAALLWKNLGLMALATLLGALVGLERERQGKSAGLRTHALVCLGSALITIVSIHGFGPVGPGLRDPARVAAQVVSGIGFLGAGTIMREGLSIRGLTTAASLWTTAGIGLAIGSGMVWPAVGATVLVQFEMCIRDSLWILPGLDAPCQPDYGRSMGSPGMGVQVRIFGIDGWSCHHSHRCV